MAKLSLNVLKLRDFRLLLSTRVLGIMAIQAQDVIVGWQIYSLTHDVFMLGLAGLTEAVPAIACALVAGHVVDISRPHRVFLYCVGMLAVNMLMLFLVAGGTVSVPHQNVLPWIFGGVFISGLARSFIMPASFSLLAQAVSRKEIPSASAWLNSGFQLAAISSPAIAGVVYGGYGVQAAWILPVSLMISAFFMLIGMSYPRRHFRSTHRAEPAAQSIRAGWRFIWRNKVLLMVMTLDMIAVLFGGAVAMLPAYADQVLHVGSEGLGALRAAPAMGAVFIALTLAVKPFELIRATTLLWVIAGFGISIICFGLSTWFWLSMLFLAISGAFDSISMVIRSTLVQLLTPDDMRGRVSAVNGMFIISSNEIGAFESGLAAKLLGLVPSVIFGGVCTLVIVGLTAWFSPRLRRTVVSADDAEK